MQGASFKVRDVEESTNDDQSYCNSNRPVGSIESKYNHLFIMYRPAFAEYQIYDGFYAEYEFKSMHPTRLFLSTNGTVRQSDSVRDVWPYTGNIYELFCLLPVPSLVNALFYCFYRL